MVLILANALFVLGEFALVTVDRTRIEQLAADGDRGAERVLAAIRRLSFNLSGAQLGITITSIVLGFAAEPVISQLLAPVIDLLPGISVEPGSGPAVVVALALATMVQMVVGELVPKSWAIARPVSTARFVVVPFSWFAVVFGPLIRVLNGAANLVVRAVGIEPREELVAVRSLDELDLLIRSSVERGTLAPTTFPLLSRGLAFADKTAADALVPRTSVVALGRDDTVGDLVRLSRESGHSRFPVFEGDLDHVVGSVHVKDAVRVSRDAWPITPLGAVMVDPPVVPESRDLASLFSEMRSTGNHLAVVVDEYGGTAGIITTEDILEEIVGDIEDEHDPARLTPLSWWGEHVVTGMAHVGELREQTGFELPEGDYETLAGFLLARLGRIPRVGEQIEFGGWTFEVLSMDGRRIDRVRVVPPPSGPDREAPP